MRPADSVRLNSVLEFGVLSQIFPKLIAGLLLGSADVIVILPPGFATCTCGTDVLCPFQPIYMTFFAESPCPKIVSPVRNVSLIEQYCCCRSGILSVRKRRLL